MTNGSWLRSIAGLSDDPTIRRLRQLAAQEAAATKERLATRTAAARLLSGAVARLAETKAVWEQRPSRRSARPGRGGRGERPDQRVGPTSAVKDSTRAHSVPVSFDVYPLRFRAGEPDSEAPDKLQDLDVGEFLTHGRRRANIRPVETSPQLVSEVATVNCPSQGVPRIFTQRLVGLRFSKHPVYTLVPDYPRVRRLGEIDEAQKLDRTRGRSAGRTFTTWTLGVTPSVVTTIWKRNSVIWNCSICRFCFLTRLPDNQGPLFVVPKDKLDVGR